MLFKAGIVLVIGTFVMFGIGAFKLSKESDLKLEAMNSFWEKTKVGSVYNYIAILEISKLDFRQGLFDIYHINNHVDFNIEILKDSTFPDVINSNLILAGHSGNDDNAYFNDLDKLVLGDEIVLFYKDTKYVYQIKNIYSQVKNGTIEIKRDDKKKTITLITCDKKNMKKQIVYIGEIVREEAYVIDD